MNKTASSYQVSDYLLSEEDLAFLVIDSDCDFDKVLGVLLAFF
jgi:hypothetical protein